jgi:hypothetical protein
MAPALGVLFEEFGDGLEFAFTVDAGDGGLGGAEDPSRGEVVHFVGVIDADVGLANDAGEKFEFVVVAGGVFVMDGDLGDGEEHVAGFEVAIADAGLAEEFDAAHFEVGEEMGVVHVAHGVAFDVADAEGVAGFVGFGRCVGHRFSQSGLRGDIGGTPMPRAGGLKAKQPLARFIVKQAGQFIRIDVVAEMLNAIDEDDGDVVVVFFEEIGVLGDVDFFDEDVDVGSDDILDHLHGLLAELTAGFGHDGDFVHVGPP